MTAHHPRSIAAMYGHAAALAAGPRCPLDDCTRPALIDSDAHDGALVCARHALDALKTDHRQELTP